MLGVNQTVSSPPQLFRALCRRERLLSDWGHTTVRLSSANSYSYEKRDVSFEHYCGKMVGPQRLDTKANGMRRASESPPHFERQTT